MLKVLDVDFMGDGEGILIIDDLVDFGKMLELVCEIYLKVYFVIVYVKL